MRVAGIREFRERLAQFLSGDEPVLLTRHGKPSGVYLPLEDSERIPDDLRAELAGVLGRHLAQLLEAQGIEEADLQRDFDEHRRGRR
jgi:prevent-host-death family protein